LDVTTRSGPAFCERPSSGCDAVLTDGHGTRRHIASNLPQVSPAERACGAPSRRPCWGPESTKKLMANRGDPVTSEAFALPDPGEQFDDLLADAHKVRSQAHEHLGGDTFALPDDPEEHVFGADVVVA